MCQNEALQASSTITDNKKLRNIMMGLSRLHNIINTPHSMAYFYLRDGIYHISFDFIYSHCILKDMLNDVYSFVLASGSMPTNKECLVREYGDLLMVDGMLNVIEVGGVAKPGNIRLEDEKKIPFGGLLAYYIEEISNLWSMYELTNEINTLTGDNSLIKRVKSMMYDRFTGQKTINNCVAYSHLSCLCLHGYEKAFDNVFVGKGRDSARGLLRMCEKVCQITGVKTNYPYIYDFCDLVRHVYAISNEHKNLTAAYNIPVKVIQRSCSMTLESLEKEVSKMNDTASRIFT